MARLEGGHARRRAEVIAAGERFHAALATVPRPSGLLDERSHGWARADRVAWGEAAGWDIPAMSDVHWLLESRRLVETDDQLIHGDLSGNVLLSGDRVSAIIDFSLYWRPAQYATAIVLVDAIVWRNADMRLLEPFLARRDGAQLLIRAVLFRLFSDSDPATGRYDAVIDRLRREAGPVSRL